MKTINVEIIEQLVNKFCEIYNEDFFKFSISPTFLAYHTTDLIKGLSFKDFLKINKIKYKYKLEKDEQIFEF